ncbi:MAG: iron complex outermembrane receptor protein [Candidatus Azotimanducaceae bacterium]|jgi:iron complex outermembrane receptor protein
MNTSMFRRGAALCAGIAMTLPVAATENVFSDVIVVTSQRDQRNSDIVYGHEAMPMAPDTAALIGRLPGAALINNGSLSGQVQYRGAYGFRVGTRINGQAFRSGGPNLMDPPMHYAPPTLVDTITVNRGAAPVSFGPSLVGGIDTRLKQVSFADSNLLEAGYDVTAIGRSADSSYAVGLVGGVASDAVRAYGYYSDERGSDRKFPGGEVDNTSYERQVYGAGIGLRHGDSEWDLEVRRQETGPTGNPPFAMDVDYVDTDFARLRFETQLADTNMAIAFGYSDVSHGMNNFDQRPPPPLAMRYRETTAAGTTYTATIDFVTLLAGGDLEYGLDIEQGDHDAFISNPNNAAFFVSSVPDVEQDRLGAFLSWQGEAGPGNLEVGIRVDQHEDSAAAAVTGPALPPMAGMLAMAFNQSDRDWSDTTLDLLARYWQESDLGTWRISLARKNRAPIHLERYGWLPIAASAGLADGNNYIGDVGLDPETAWIAEVGIDLVGASWWLRPTVFYHDVDDYIQGTPFDDTPGVFDTPVEMVSMMNGDPTPLQFTNVEARMFGVDADFGWQLAENWHLEGVISVVRGERRDISDDLYRISPDRLSLALVYEQSRWSVSLAGEGVRAQGKVSVTNNEQETPGYGLMHLFANWQVSDNFHLSGGVENLFDREYEQHLAGYNRVSESGVSLGGRLPGTGLNVFLKVSLRR